MSIAVLIAEDEPNIVESLRFILTRADCTVEVAYDGEEALSKLRRGRPDLLILDVMLPKQNGFEVLKTLRGEHDLADLPVLILTAKGQQKDRRTAEEMGASAFLTKPFANQDVIDLVQQLAGAA